MDNPVLVEVTRGGRVESRHRGAFVIMDGGGHVVAASGDIDRPVFPRSAVKAIQALPLIESGAADAFVFDDADLALACASHSGEPGHVERAASMLARAGLSEADLECGSHWAADPAVLIEQARAMECPNQLHNNCSGKHAGFLCTCRHLGFATKGYVAAGHAEQRLIAETMSAVTGAAHDADNAAIDGCADAKQDHQALAAQSVGTLMASPALRLDAASTLGDRLMRGASHAKWRSRRAAAAALGAYAAARACLGDAAECTKVAQALGNLLGDDTSEVRDAATGSFSVMAVIAAPAQRDAFCQAQLDRAKAALPLRRPPKRKKAAVVDVSGAQRLGAVTALGACVLAYPYDVPAHVPASLVALARHSHTTSSSNGGARHAAAVREAVRATFAEFKRTHAETWDFVRPLFSSEELDALADILSAGDYLV